MIATRKAFIGLSTAVVGWTAFVTTRPDAVAISYMFDDAFYYLVPAHAFATDGTPQPTTFFYKDLR